MEVFERKSRVFLVLILFLFLVSIPFVMSRALAEPSDSGADFCTFPPGTTVEFLQSELDRVGQSQTVKVFLPNATRKTSGEIVTGDTVEVCDVAGHVQSRVIAEVSDSASSLDLSGLLGASSEGPSSAGSSPDGGTPGSETPSSSGTEDANDYIYSQPVTVADLREQIADKIEAGCLLDVTAASGQKRESGYICTGDVVRVLRADGSEESRVTAIVLGDLIRGGLPTARSSEALYEYLTGQQNLDPDLKKAADLDQNGKVDTADLLLLKKMISAANSG